MKIAILNDSHIGARNASNVFLNYFAKFYGDIFFPYCKEHGITQILHLGDMFDNRKIINFKALNHYRQTFLTPMVDMGMVMDIIPGNHDVFYKNTNDVCSLKELLGYFMNNVNIVMKPRVMNYGGAKIALLPWINSQNYDDSMKFIQTCKAPILAGHLELTGFEVMRGIKMQHGMEAGLFSRFEQVWSGHFHTKSQRENIQYLGTQYEMTWSDCDDPKYFHVYDTETGELTPVANPYTIYEKIIYDDRGKMAVPDVSEKFVKIIVVNKDDLFAFDQYLDAINKKNPFEVKIAENYDEFMGENVSDSNLEKLTDTSELIAAYVDATHTDLDKEILKRRLSELYVEAQNLEVI